ncbi:cyclin-dependent protein kinase inhibitor SMR3-like [Benincasa hispida]|uniref:cyclin-dependent protein kinase inhibitor SMR3-like n=1 Tax=Benincasa hispida TaxID=102211 RepID=UPI001901BBE8|nr:cyclin-dependent protein kinase inhibitor SMR3-like [Benincasa hispida]
MASEFQEISLTLPDQISFSAITPQPTFRLNQIDFIFSLNNEPDRLAPAESISAVDDDDDGFRTPVSSDHKIPVVRHCPPAPKRPKPISLSRTSSMRASGVRRGFRVYISDEIVDSIFCSDLLHQKSKKKARKDDDDNGGE